MKTLRMTPVVHARLGAGLLALLMLPPVRHALESSMSLHMLAQYPLLMLAGALLGAALPQTLSRRLSAWNGLGISGLTACALILAVSMIPRVLDLALLDAWVESAKFAALLLAGGVLRLSWRAAGLVVQGFFLGNILPMMILVGTLYQDSPLRLCNAYRYEDQQHLGFILVGSAIALAVAWSLQVLRRLSAETGTSPSLGR